jgi:hypothetical protein
VLPGTRATADRRHRAGMRVKRVIFNWQKRRSLSVAPLSLQCQGFAPLPSTSASASVQPACPEAGHSADMCKRPPFEARSRKMIRGGSGEGSTLLTLFKNIQQCYYTLCFFFLVFWLQKDSVPGEHHVGEMRSITFAWR